MRKRNKLYKLYTVSTKVKPNVFCYDCNKKLSCRWQTRDALVLMQWHIALLRSAWKKIRFFASGFSRSLKVIGTDTDWSAIFDFLQRSIAILSVRNTVFETFDFENAVTLKSGLGVRQGHWKCHHSIERIWLPIDVL